MERIILTMQKDNEKNGRHGNENRIIIIWNQEKGTKTNENGKHKHEKYLGNNSLIH